MKKIIQQSLAVSVMAMCASLLWAAPIFCPETLSVSCYSPSACMIVGLREELFELDSPSNERQLVGGRYSFQRASYRHQGAEMARCTYRGRGASIVLKGKASVLLKPHPEAAGGWANNGDCRAHEASQCPWKKSS